MVPHWQVDTWVVDLHMQKPTNSPQLPWWHLGLKLRVCVSLLMSCTQKASTLPLQRKISKSESGRQIWGQFNSDISSRLSSVHFQKFKKCYPRLRCEEITFGFLRRCWLAKVKANHCFNSACRCCLCQIKLWISSSSGSDGLKLSNRAGVGCLLAPWLAQRTVS